MFDLALKRVNLAVCSVHIEKSAVQQRTAKFRCRCYRRAGIWSSFDRGEKNAATAATAATATTDLDAERAREKSDGSFGAEEILDILNDLMIFQKM